MRNKVAKRLHRQAKIETVGQPIGVTRKRYKALKKAHKA